MASKTDDAARAVETAQDEFVSAVRQNQQAILDSVSAWAKAVNEISPAGPSLEGFPAPETVVDNAFDFAQKLLEAQHDFARGMIAATSAAHEGAAQASSRQSSKS
jgi:hypothetical protein